MPLSMDEYEHDTHEDRKGKPRPPVPRVTPVADLSIDRPPTDEEREEAVRARRIAMGEDPDKEWLREDNPHLWEGDVDDLWEP